MKFIRTNWKQLVGIVGLLFSFAGGIILIFATHEYGGGFVMGLMVDDVFMNGKKPLVLDQLKFMLGMYFIIGGFFMQFLQSLFSLDRRY